MKVNANRDPEVFQPVTLTLIDDVRGAFRKAGGQFGPRTDGRE